jgi:hypothetical protein
VRGCIGSISAYCVYYSSFSPIVVSASSANLPSDVAAGGSIVINWTKFTERSSFSLIYTPSYTAYIRKFLPERLESRALPHYEPEDRSPVEFQLLGRRQPQQCGAVSFYSQHAN